VSAPMTLGVFRQIIILPERLFDSASSEILISALGHEMAHIRRRDFGLNLIYQLLSLPVAFHPAVALIKRRINQTRELACDEMVADHLVDARAYARSLVYLAGLASNPGQSIHRYDHNLGVLDADNLEERVMKLIENKPRLGAKRNAALLIAVSLILTISAATASSFSLSLKQEKGPKPDFSGKWRSQSTTGDVPFPPGYTGETLEVDHKDPELKFISIFEADRKWTREIRFGIDGNERDITFTVDGNEYTMRFKAEWIGKKMIITWGEGSETWEISDDHKTLTLHREHGDTRGRTILTKQ
jgi:BlaR1 peptidase M56